MAEVDLVELFLSGIFAPPVLFFLFGILSTLVKADLEIPAPVTTILVVILMTSIGLGGGGKAVEALKAYPAVIGVVVTAAISSVLLGIIFAGWSGKILRDFVGLKTADAWASAGQYAAVSSATLFVGVAIAEYHAALAPVAAEVYAGWMPAMYPFMDTPALLAAILLGRMAITRETLGSGVDIRQVLRTTLLGPGIWMLIGSLVIGVLAQLFSPREMALAMNFFDGMFRGVLCLFLLDMGINAGTQLRAVRELGGKIFKAVLVAWALPQVHALLGILAMYLINLFIVPGAIGWADAFVFATIAGGASFITAPAAMRSALPGANPSIYLPMSLVLTFPFNVTIGMTLWKLICMTLWGTH
jgi:hypothetical protein